MFELVKEDVFEWFLFHVHRDNIEERYRYPEEMRPAFEVSAKPGVDVSQLMEKAPWAWRRRIYWHKEVKLYFVYLYCGGCHFNTGFLPEIESLNSRSILPDFEFLEQYQSPDGDGEITLEEIGAEETTPITPAKEPAPLPGFEEGCEIFLRKMGELIPLYKRRNAEIRPLESELLRRLRDSMMEYVFLTGGIAIPSKPSIEEGPRGNLIVAHMRNFLPTGRVHENIYFYPVEKLKSTGVWQLNEEEETRLAAP